ncbi:phosphoglyceromutase [Nitzschia inconspicua]|uniref:Phosphoglyceromutase n=1 Tax=Nitzschia inconspicua TaxID=303405 RepID=A0A9K3PQ52_9STRA|nr:phosphoglyceromutase [Nitzschia inconspicua]
MLPPTFLLRTAPTAVARNSSSLVKAAAVSSSSSSATSFQRPLHHHQDQQSKSFTTINKETPYNLCFLRHGQSTWNRDNRFIGWTDTPLTDDGVLEARLAGKMLQNSGILFDEVHTSLLRRSIRTVNLVLMEMGQEYIPVYKHYRLNERHYGDLVGKNKKETVKMFGKDQVKRWRRSYDEPPPPMAFHHEYHPAKDPRYRHMTHLIPDSESLQCTKARSSVYWDEVIAPALQQGKTVLVVGHENNLRSLIMELEDIPKEDIINLCLPRAVPLAYRLDENLKPLDRPDGKLDEATGFLRGEWLGGDDAVAEILERDRKQVYDTTVEQNLEMDESRKKWSDWMNLIVGEASPEAKAKAERNDEKMVA